MRIQDRKIPAPETNPETLPYWEAADRGELVIRRCRSCGKAHHYPRTICPLCFSPETEWQTASGRGVIYSYSVMRLAGGHYVVAYVTLEEGPTMMTNIVDTDVEAISIGQPVNVVFKTTESGPKIPMFAPAEPGKPA